MTVGGGVNRFDDGAKNYWLQYRFFYGFWKTDLYNHNFKLHLPLVCILLIEFKLMNVRYEKSFKIHNLLWFLKNGIQ